MQRLTFAANQTPVKVISLYKLPFNKDENKRHYDE